MSKVAAYLQEHILGEVSTDPAILKTLGMDASVLEISPEMAVYPRVTNDIRKVARFVYQLSEKGHVMSITVRGSGSDQTGAAIGKGISIVLPAHMNRIFELDSKQKLVRVQPGVNAKALNDALLLQGMFIPALPTSAAYSTIGGAVANNASGPLSGKYGDMSEWVHQLEVVLVNGDVLQTERLSKRELDKKKGLQTLEGEIYRRLDNLIEDNRQLIDDKLVSDIRDNVGYSAITKVKRKDGSFDLTPLIVGSQGTLGIISEMILKAQYISTQQVSAFITFANKESARDLLEKFTALKPSVLEYFDGQLFVEAEKQGKTYPFYDASSGAFEAGVMIGFDDFSDRARQNKLKKVTKLIESVDAQISVEGTDDAGQLFSAREVTTYLLAPVGKDVSAPPIVDGAYIPNERFEDFQTAVAALAAKHHINLPIHTRALDCIVYARPALELRKIADKQKIFKLLDEYAALVERHGGHLIAEAGEGRVKARFAHKNIGEDVAELFASIKAIFDEHTILNPGVKQSVDLRTLVADLRTDYDTSAFANYTLYS
ncbi:MAG TPA: FAD-binding oxidoreductase [Candidatus Saccharimonadales bacterium]|jgi:FAD/FMN-containing dehydrogenase|nr:FAD-binding oxidoreductase [Candidatus Saccharimonadales bacterium]